MPKYSEKTACCTATKASGLERGQHPQHHRQVQRGMQHDESGFDRRGLASPPQQRPDPEHVHAAALQQVAGLAHLGGPGRASPRGPPSWPGCGARPSSSARHAITGSTRTLSRTRRKSLESPVRSKAHAGQYSGPGARRCSQQAPSATEVRSDYLTLPRGEPRPRVSRTVSVHGLTATPSQGIARELGASGLVVRAGTAAAGAHEHVRIRASAGGRVHQAAMASNSRRTTGNRAEGRY
jgi:hypothetical protein